MKIAIALAIVVGIILLVTLALQWAWNLFAAPEFGLPQISYLQALALQVILWAIKSPATRIPKSDE